MFDPERIITTPPTEVPTVPPTESPEKGKKRRKKEGSGDVETKQERIKAFEATVLDIVEKKVEEAFATNNSEQILNCAFDVLPSLGGMDDNRSWKIRKQFANIPEKRPSLQTVILLSLAGIDSPRAWELRKQMKDTTAGGYGMSLTGLESEEAWKERPTLKEPPFSNMLSTEYADSLFQLESDRAWAERDTLLNESLARWKALEGQKAALTAAGEQWKFNLHSDIAKEKRIIGSIGYGISGMNSPRAQELRKKIINEANGDKEILNSISFGMTGLDSPTDWETREQLIAKGVDKICIAAGLGGIDSERARKIKEEAIAELMKKRMPHSAYLLNTLAMSLTGLTSDHAQEMRQELVDMQKKYSPNNPIETVSFAGDATEYKAIRKSL